MDFQVLLLKSINIYKGALRLIKYMIYSKNLQKSIKTHILE